MKHKAASIIIASILSLSTGAVFAKPVTQEEMPIAGDSEKTKMGGMKHGGGMGGMGGMDHGGGKKGGCDMMADGKGGMNHGDSKKGGKKHDDSKKQDKKAAKKKRQKMMDAKLNRIDERLEVIETMLQQLLNKKK